MIYLNKYSTSVSKKRKKSLLGQINQVLLFLLAHITQYCSSSSSLLNDIGTNREEREKERGDRSMVLQQQIEDGEEGEMINRSREFF
jgi:hypothetical protein